MDRQPLLSEISRRRKLALLLAHAPARGRVLEVGCGDGWLTRQLRSRGFDVTTLDLEGAPDVRGDIRDWRALGLAPASFDVVIALEVIEHVDCLDALRALARPDGLVYLSSPHPKWDWAMQLLERVGLNQQRTSPHTNLTDFARIPLSRVVLKRPAWIHQVGLFRNRAA